MSEGASERRDLPTVTHEIKRIGDMCLDGVVHFSERIERGLVKKVCDVLGWNDQEKQQ